MDDLAISVAQPYYKNAFYNPSAVYQTARQVRFALEKSRGQVASVLGAKDQEIIFTAGGTEANNLAINGVLGAYPDGHLVVSAIEHESVLEPASQYQHSILPVDSKGIIKLDKLKGLITPKTVLVSIMYANNEVGVVQPIKEVSQLIKVIRAARLKSGNTRPLYLHTDAAQAANYLDLSVSRLAVDMMTLNGGKIYAYKQSGCLYVKTGVSLRAQVRGGGQEASIRSGTENLPAILAFATMLQKVQQMRKAENKRLEQLRDKLFTTLSQNCPDIILNGSDKKRLPNNLNITIPGADGERLVMELDEAGLMVATGSACSASSDEPSHVLIAMGLSVRDASSSLRITLGQPTTETEIESAAATLSKIISKHQRLV